MIESFKGIKPVIGKDCFIHESAVLIGDVVLGDHVSVWPGAVLRGDMMSIVVGDNTNIQDLSALHTNPRTPLIVGKNVIIGHGVQLHSCRVGNDTLIGTGSIVLDEAVVENECIVAAGTLIPPRKLVQSGSVMMGNPVKRVRSITREELFHHRAITEEYIRLYRIYQKED